MATLKYKDGNEWKKVSIGGGGSTEEVYVGSDKPTDENVKVWIDPTGTPSGGNGDGTSGGGSNVYVFPERLTSDDSSGDLTFNAEEVEEFKAAINDMAHTIFVIMLPQGDALLKVTLTSVMWMDIGEGDIQYAFMGTYFIAPTVANIECIMPIVIVKSDGSVTLQP